MSLPHSSPLGSFGPGTCLVPCLYLQHTHPSAPSTFLFRILSLPKSQHVLPHAVSRETGVCFAFAMVTSEALC